MLDSRLDLLKEGNTSCVIIKNDEILYRSGFIGVKPLLHFMEQYEERSLPTDLILIDKVIGKAALLLAVKLGIKEIYTPLTSLTALEAAELHQVKLHAEKTVPYIINREKTGMCPLEQSVTDTMDPEEALTNIRQAIAVLMSRNPVS